MNTISLTNALQKKILTEYSNPVISYYSFTKVIGELYRDKSYEGVPIGKISSTYPSKRVIDGNLQSLLLSGGLSEVATLPIYEIAGHKPPSVQQIICELNPFCYLSYLTAMEWHSLTDRIPKTVHVTTCTSKEFKRRAIDQKSVDFPGIGNELAVPLKHHDVSKSIRGKTIREHSTSNYEDKKTISQSGGIRVSSVGETFLDMLKKPDFCGGVNHVLDIFTEHAPNYLPVIVRAVNKKGRPIDKVKAGYLLEERLNLKHPDFEHWKSYAQRGGSRKFVSSAPYQNKHSETWCISLNFADG